MCRLFICFTCSPLVFSALRPVCKVQSAHSQCVSAKWKLTVFLRRVLTHSVHSVFPRFEDCALSVQCSLSVRPVRQNFKAILLAPSELGSKLGFSICFDCSFKRWIGPIKSFDSKLNQKYSFNRLKIRYRKTFSKFGGKLKKTFAQYSSFQGFTYILLPNLSVCPEIHIFFVDNFPIIYTFCYCLPVFHSFNHSFYF